jgi:hypothetical protein
VQHRIPQCSRKKNEHVNIEHLGDLSALDMVVQSYDFGSSSFGRVKFRSAHVCRPRASVRWARSSGCARSLCAYKRTRRATPPCRATSHGSSNSLLPVPVLAKMFRGKMLAMVKAAHADGRLAFFSEHAGLADKAAFKAYLDPIYDTKWHVYAKRPFAGPEAVLAYLARYTHRVAISNSRLVGIDERGVTFKYKDYRIKGPDRYKTMTVVPGEFIRRFMLHVLPKGFHRIRHYGLLASSRTKAETLVCARSLIAAATPPKPAWSPPQQPADGETIEKPAHPCPCCGGVMVIIETFDAGYTPRHRPSPAPVPNKIDTS